MSEERPEWVITPEIAERIIAGAFGDAEAFSNGPDLCPTCGAYWQCDCRPAFKARTNLVTTWDCGACGHANHMSARYCDGCNAYRYNPPILRGLASGHIHSVRLPES